MDVSIIIVNYNTLELTQACIDSVFEKTEGLEYEVILVDNASTDGSKEYFEKDDRITYLYNEENYGFGKANNIGAKEAKGKYLFFLNSDTYLLNNALWLFFDAAEKEINKSIGFWGTVLLGGDDKPNGYGSSFPSLIKSLKEAVHWRQSEMSLCNVSFPFYVDYVLGADIFTSKYLFDTLDGFDEDYFMYYEESDLQRRAYKKGYKARIIRKPRIVHLEGKSTERVSHKKRMMVEKSHMIYLRKHNSRFSYDMFLMAYLILRLPVFLTNHYSFSENCDYLKMLISTI